MCVLPRGGGVLRVQQGLYDSRFEHDSCGVGFVTRKNGEASHELLKMGLEALSRLGHRGAVAADGTSGDGAGVMTGIPRRLLHRCLVDAGISVDSEKAVASGIIFVEQSELGVACSTLTEALAEEELDLLCWREVPVTPHALGETARRSMPVIRQVVVAANAVCGEDDLEIRLHRARKKFERTGLSSYVVSLSSRTMVYKALCGGAKLREFYCDLQNPEFETSFILFHQRYATNTHPSWSLAQPFRFLAHNGEINTIGANRVWMKAREAELPPEFLPVLREGGSDSCHLDETAEVVVRSRRDLLQSLSMLIVPAWQGHPAFQEMASYCRDHAALIEPWDGPAAITFADGRYVGAALDRNGLRPLRYAITADGLVGAGSEVGLFDFDPDLIEVHGRVGPGQMIAVDLEAREFLDSDSVKRLLTSRGNPNKVRIYPAEAAPTGRTGSVSQGSMNDAQSGLFGYTREELKLVLGAMSRDGKEPVWSMGDDTPISVLAQVPRSLYTHFRQRFAQVTNPPIDPLREEMMMSLRTTLGGKGRLFGDEAQATTLVEIPSPILSESERDGISQSLLTVAEIQCVLPAGQELEAQLKQICARAQTAVKSGAAAVVLSDRTADLAAPPVPMALAVGAVHHHLIRAGLRMRCDIVADAGDCWDVHHVAVLIGYGAAAVCPWLALRSCESHLNLLDALRAGLKKVMSKLGISDVSSYRAGEFFQTIGFEPGMVGLCFSETPNLAGAYGLEAVQRELEVRAARCAKTTDSDLLPDFGWIRYRKGNRAEQHAWSPVAVRAMQTAVGVARRQADTTSAEEAWKEFDRYSESLKVHNVRDLLDFVRPADPAPIGEVEPAAQIARRFVSSAMSLGSISPEAHRTLSQAMNLLGGKSNTGEGGEDPEVYRSARDANNKVKQVASARFGVTTEYLVNAEELEIKIAQGSKPGEGGQLPAAKVTELIARLRHAQTGISLISPPPHHDIYSIEDLSQLIHDLKQVNPSACVGVKLVSEAGIGTIASGVAKAHADYIVISGHAGGTGASPLSSIKHAGAPWELGLAETQQTLMRNGLRSRVRLRVDGGLRTARDVVIGALLGAEEFAFGTAALVSLGCDMARQCHLDTCPTGIATQRPELRAKFRGKPEHVVAYFLHIAEDVRALLAELGLKSLDEAIGRCELLRQSTHAGVLQLSALLFKSEGDASRSMAPGNNGVGAAVEDPFGLKLAREVVATVRTGQSFDGEFVIRNQHRSAGAAISGELVRQLGTDGITGSEVRLSFRGCAGQSFGAFCVDGMELELEGEANDYVGKGLSGGAIILKPRGKATLASNENVILGNVALYGATSGRLFAAGRAGERFAVRNSGAVAVVEGVGDHGCEYMTGGAVVVLGEIGCNFGAGMTGGHAYIFDPANLAESRVNAQTVMVAMPDPDQLRQIETLVRLHSFLTGSSWAQRLLGAWQECSRYFRSVTPIHTAKPHWAGRPSNMVSITDQAPPAFPQA